MTLAAPPRTADPVPLWRDRPPEAVSAGESVPGRAHVLPSGRQALSAALAMAGLGRADRVAIPEWSSACVIAAAGAVATPIPMGEVLAAGHRVAAVLHYDQWGWPCPPASLARLAERFPDAALILDKVDSATLADDPRLAALDHAVAIELWSLSKILGFSGGGLMRRQGRFEAAAPYLDSGHRWPARPDAIDPATFAAMAKAWIRALAPDLETFLAGHSLAGAVVDEGARRRANIEALAETEAAAAWPRWMNRALAEGAAPGLAPLYLGAEDSVLADHGARVRRCHGLDAGVYHFNASGDPLAPRYRLCLAIPVHGQVAPETLAAALSPPRRKRRGSAHGAVVVGGGVAGLVAARLLAERGPVRLIERSQELGGLMRSAAGPDGLAFDLGTHFILATGHPELDALLFDRCDAQGWWRFTDSLREGHVVNGRLNSATGCLDATTLPDDLLTRAQTEIVRADSGAGTTLADHFAGRYGAVLTRHLLTPAIEKLTGLAPDQLEPDAHAPFSLNRVVAFDRDTSRVLKQAPALDAKLAFADRRDGRSTIVKYYPKSGGVGRWIDMIREELVALGVTIERGKAVDSLIREQDRITAVRCDGGDSYSLDSLVWTLPLAFYLRALGEPVPGMPPVMRDLVVIDFVFDQALTSDLHWVCCYDKDDLTYRTTLYPNIGARRAPPHHLTVEVLTDRNAEFADLVARVWEEQIAYGLVPRGAEPRWSRTRTLPNAVPVRSLGFARSQAAQSAAAAGSASNVTLLGRAAGSHFQIETLRGVFAALAEAP